MIGALLLQHEQRALDGADRGLGDVAVFRGQCVGARGEILEQRLQVLEVEQRQFLFVGDPEGDVEHALLRLAQIHEPREEQRPHLRDRRPDRMALLAEQVPEDHRIGLKVGLISDLLGARLDPGLGLPFVGDTGEIALHIGGEHRNAPIGEGFRQALQGDGLAGARSAGDQAVTVGEAQIDELGLDALPDIDAVGGRLGSRGRALAYILFRRCLALRHAAPPLD
jgi:hypothetical protein